MRQYPTLPASDYRQDLPGVFATGVMAIACGSLYHSACNEGNNAISLPHFLTGTAEYNNGCYPVAESMMAAAMVGTVALLMLGNALKAKCQQRAASDEGAPLVGSSFVLTQTGDSYYGWKNALSLHLPRLALAASMLALMVFAPWISVAVDLNVRDDSTDPDEAESLAGSDGRLLLALMPVVSYFATCALTLIKNANYIRHKDEPVSKSPFEFFTQHLFVDHSQRYDVVARPAVAV